MSYFAIILCLCYSHLQPNIAYRAYTPHIRPELDRAPQRANGAPSRSAMAIKRLVAHGRGAQLAAVGQASAELFKATSQRGLIGLSA